MSARARRDDGMGFEIHGGDDPEAEEITTHKSVLLFGESGTGKTAALCRAAVDMHLDFEDVAYKRVKPVGDPSIFLLALEQNGLATARMINPRIRWALASPFDDDGNPDPGRAIKVATSVFRAAASGRLQEQGIKLLVIDGLTELQRLRKDVIVESNRIDKDRDGGRDWFDQDDWGFLNESSRRLMNTTRNLPIDVGISALEGRYETRQKGVEQVSPKLEGKKIPGEAMSFYTACGRATKIEDRRSDGSEHVDFRVMFSGPGRYMVKSSGPVMGWQRPCLQAWMEVLHGTRDPEDTRIRSTVVDPDGRGAAPSGDDSDGAPSAGASRARSARSARRSLD